MYNQWYLVTWAIHQAQVLHSLVTHQQAKRNFMANILWMLKARMLLLVSEHQCQLTNLLKQTKKFMSNLLKSQEDLKITTKICKIWSLQLKEESFSCCKLVMVREQLVLHWRSLVIWLKRAWLQLMRHFWRLSQSNLILCCIQHLTKKLSKKQRLLQKVFLHLQVLLVVKLLSLQKKLLKERIKAKKLFL